MARGDRYRTDPNPRRVYSPVPPASYHNGRSVTTASSDMYTYTTDTNVTEEHSEDYGCGAWAKYGIFTANIVFLVVGGLLLAMGIWLRTDSRFRNFIIMGAVMIVVAMLGCCGITGRSRLFLVIYSMVVFLLFVATLSAGIYLLYKKDGLDVELSDALNYMVQHYYMGAGVVQEALDKLQTTFRCCGNAGCSDFRVFRMDIPRSCDIRCDGCHFRIMVALRIGFSVTLIVFFAVVLCQLLAICFALYFVFMRQKEVKIIYYSTDSSKCSGNLACKPWNDVEKIEDGTAIIEYDENCTVSRIQCVAKPGRDCVYTTVWGVLDNGDGGPLGTMGDYNATVEFKCQNYNWNLSNQVIKKAACYFNCTEKVEIMARPQIVEVVTSTSSESPSTAEPTTTTNKPIGNHCHVGNA
ncbi:unnamed protein product [Caenorhabditis sp. 36 PRJEB53466]|nr:unnamed protein product [Caenorhabditis sp. 36 PRJEB53466]